MDPIAQLGKDAYHALCIAFAAQSKDKLYSPDARDLLGVTEEEDRTIRAQIDQDPRIAALRRGELPPGGIRPLLLPSSRWECRGGTPFGGMPPPTAGAAAAAATPATGGGGGFDAAPYSSSQPKAAAAKKTAATPNSAAAAPAAAGTTGGGASGPSAPGATGSSLVGRKLQRLYPDLSPPWVTGTVMSYNTSTGRHLIQWGPPLRRESWECIADFAPQNFRWLEPGAEPAGLAGGGGAKAGTASKTGGSKSTPKSSTPKAPPPPPAPKTAPAAATASAAAATAVPGLSLPGGPSTFHATGVSLTSAPYNESFLRTCLAKNRPEDLSTTLSAIDDREIALGRELVALVEDPGDAADINRLLDESQRLAQREQQLRAELRELGVMG
ncbi:hypothetical protein VOLCADRAFT_94073 [Volvox carteri f. nagariensis]|uniref:ENT domain-containing protein n=1 Tax=Volvox carteri f. nagariensis TaxID=3068 RepID=D8U3U7_VOLCA|nr:uncharacterized protein VOLCADRAFT_94073 [Volvox carteri f. nagariensis]EFJ45672.1 hypothetical protein VOLCADRAFT_94073 [Volvox carteri f. nagariensis]|eukprot:XP_002953362.1 hypothetical protein VOLCADRAFT_94073 [Volvox carteri f. nagariensis]